MKYPMTVSHAMYPARLQKQERAGINPLFRKNNRLFLFKFRGLTL